MKKIFKKCFLQFKFVFILLIAISGIHQSFAEDLKVLTFNTWGVPLVVWDTWRYRESMRVIEKLSPDIVLLQEVFTEKARQAYRSKDYPHVALGPKALPRLIGSGFRILSKSPIIRSAKMHFKTCKGDDCLSQKGAVIALIQLPNQQFINVLNTHLNARGGDQSRLSQLTQLAHFIRKQSDSRYPILVSGDFNFNPDTVGYNYLMKQLGALDLWRETQDRMNPGYTSDSVNNLYAREYNLKTNFPLTQDRLDYQFISQQRSVYSLKALNSEIVFNQDRIYSDHYGLLAQYSLL